MFVVVLAGGLGTRMLPHTETLPKSMLEVAGRPFIAWLLEKLRDDGFEDVLLCVGHLGEQIERYVERSGRFGLRVRYARETNGLLGTAGAIAAAAADLPERFLVTYGDALLPFRYTSPLDRLAISSDLDAVMAVWKNAGDLAPSNAHVLGDRVVAYQKQDPPGWYEHIDYGAIALRRKVLVEVPPRIPHGLDALQSGLARDGRLGAVHAHEAFREIGSTEGLVSLDRELRGALRAVA